MKLGQLFGSKKKAGDIEIDGKRVGDYETWDGNLDLYFRFHLASLEGCPKVVKGNFICGENNLTTLKGCPEEVTGQFNCSHNKLISLEGCPKKVGREFYCNDDYLTSLKGCPEEINGDFCCIKNQLTSLEGCPKEIFGNFNLLNNKLKDLHNIHKFLISCSHIDVSGNPLKSHILGLLKIKNLKEVILDNEKVAEIINKYLPLGDIFACQEELIEAGFEEYAQL